MIFDFTLINACGLQVDYASLVKFFLDSISFGNIMQNDCFSYVVGVLLFQYLEGGLITAPGSGLPTSVPVFVACSNEIFPALYLVLGRRDKGSKLKTGKDEK